MNMRLFDTISLSFGAVRAHRLRSGLTALGIAVGVAAVILLTSIGEGVHQFVLSEFTQFGTSVLGVTPGRKTTFGGSVGIFGTIRPLTIDDAEALKDLPSVVSTEGIVQGNAEVESNERRRRTTVLGVGYDMPQILRFEVERGRFLPPDDPRRARPFAVLGSKVASELFGRRSPLGDTIRIAGLRFRIVGVMESKGQFLGLDLDDAVYVPTSRALELFDREGVMEIHVLYDPAADSQLVAASVTRLLTNRHQREDFTLTTQDQMIETLGDVLAVLTLAVGALGGISLLVGSIGILTMMTMSVRERRAEIGLLRTLGTPQRQILRLFLLEATVLALVGGAVGLALGIGLGQLLHALIPALPVALPWSYAILAECLAGLIGLASGVVPAFQAARLGPIEALRAE